jgi:hypothetical protein
MLGVTAPGIQQHYEETPSGTRTVWLLHPDGSWARATAMGDDAPPKARSSRNRSPVSCVGSR